MNNKAFFRDFNPIMFIVFLAIAVGYYLGPTITGLITGEFVYSDEVNLLVTTDGSYIWDIENPGKLKYIRLKGSIVNAGTAKVYVENNGIRYLIFDSTLINETPAASNGSSFLITGFVVGDSNIAETNLTNQTTEINETTTENNNQSTGQTNETINHPPTWNSNIEEFFLNGSTVIDLSDYFYDEDDDTLSYNVLNPLNVSIIINGPIFTLIPDPSYSGTRPIIFTANDSAFTTAKTVLLNIFSEISEPVENITLPQNDTIEQNETIQENQTTDQKITEVSIINNSINIIYKYKSGSIYDENDDGIENLYGIVDLTIENTEFNWDVDKSKLCTRWNIISLEDSKSTTVCYGSEYCCNFVDLVPSRDSWNETFLSYYNHYGEGSDNIVSAQIIYYDNKSIDQTDIKYSIWTDLETKFISKYRAFTNTCIETCSLKDFKKTNYKLIFEITGNVTLIIDNIIYGVISDVQNAAPSLITSVPNITLFLDQVYSLDLSNYFEDFNQDPLMYTYFKPKNIDISIEGDIATITPIKDYTGTSFSYFIANDTEYISVSNVFRIEVLEPFTTEPGLFIIEGSNITLATIDSFGNLNLRGSINEQVLPNEDDDDFVIKNSAGESSLVITNPGANMQLRNILFENQTPPLIPTENSFIIENRTGQVVAYLNNDGDLYLTGFLNENTFFEE